MRSPHVFHRSPHLILSRLRSGSDLGRVDFAFQLFDYMMTLQLPPNSYASPHILSPHPPHFTFRPNSYTFNDLVELCVRAGDLRRALQVLYEMKSAGWTPSNQTQDALLVGCARSNEPMPVLVQLVEQQRSEGRPVPAATGIELVKCLAACGRHADAVELFGMLHFEQTTPGSLEPQIVRDGLQTLHELGSDRIVPEALRRLIQLFQKVVTALCIPVCAYASFLSRVKHSLFISLQMADRLQMASASISSNTATWAAPPTTGTVDRLAETHGANSLGGEHVSIGAALSSLPDDEPHASSLSPEIS